MWHIFLISIIIILIFILYLMYIYVKKILNCIDEMIESAINNTFSESLFTENKLSRLETKMYRYLSAGNTSLKQINTEKDRIKTLTSDISHQTKTVISNIMLYSQLLEEQAELDESTKKLVWQIENQTEKLYFLIQSLMKTSRLENGIIKVNPKKNSVNKLIDNIDYKDFAYKKGIKLIIENISEINAVFDFKWTLEAVSNIVDNALKYTPLGGIVKIGVKEYEMFVCIYISDSGIGISEDETSKIFTRFYRSQNVSDIQGVGIGLYLSREILSKEGGYIKVSSKINKGSTFSIFLPKFLNTYSDK